jgi:hypothetical protein
MSTVALTIDYSNGSQRHFSSLPWKKGLTILEVLQASGAAITFGSDRAGHAIGLVIDAMPADDKRTHEWVVWVNASAFKGRLGTPTSFGLVRNERESNEVNAGDYILFKLSRVAEEA